MSACQAGHVRFSLSDWACTAQFNVVRDACFAQLGLMSSRRPSTLVPYFDDTYTGELLSNANITAVLTTAELAARMPDIYGIAVCEKPVDVFFRLHHAMARDPHYVGVDFPTTIGPGGTIHGRACVSATGVTIGRNVVIEAHAVVLPGAVLGDDVTVQAGAIIGSDGHETRLIDSEPVQVEHIGRAVIGDRVVVGYQSMVDRAVFLEDTVVGDGTKIGALSIVAHGCSVGRRCRIRSRVTIAGATVVGDDVVMGPSATVSNALTVGDGAIVAIGEIVTANVPAGMVAIGKKLVTAERYNSIRKLFDRRRLAAGRHT